MANARSSEKSAIGRLGRSLGVALALGCTTVLATTPTTSSGVRLLANALIMDGTTFPTPSQGFMESAISDFIAPSTPGSYIPVAVRTPEQIFGINQSVSDGVADLEAAMVENGCTPGQSCVVFGYSQSTVITMIEKAKLQQEMAAGEPVPNVTFVGIGVGNRPNGGIAERLSGIVIPFVDFTFNGASPDDPEHPIKTIDIARQYDGLADFPEFPLNPVADANAVLGVVFVHLLYGEEVSLDPNSPDYVDGTVKQQDGDTTYYWIPTAELPLFDPLRLAGVPESVIDIVQPFAKVLVEAGYDRSVAFGEPTPAQLIPTIDPVTFSIELAAATLEGADNAAKLVGGELPGYAALKQQLSAAQASSAAAIGVPYHDVVSSINDAVNPFQTFAQIEGPLATQFDGVVNGLGVPRLLNQVIDPVLTPITAWAEDKVLLPQAGTTPGPIASAARQFLSRVAPNLGRAPGSQPPSTALAPSAAVDTTNAQSSVKKLATATWRRERQRATPQVVPPNRHGTKRLSSHSAESVASVATQTEPKRSDTVRKSPLQRAARVVDKVRSSRHARP
jgi:PE-PPE domain